MNELLLIGIGIFLFIVSIIDWKTKVIPSIFLTGGLFVVIAVNQANLFYGLLAFVLSYLLYEADFFGGVADIKIMTLLGFLIPSFSAFGIYILCLAVFGVTWKIIYKVRYKNESECPFLPVFFFIFLALVFGGII